MKRRRDLSLKLQPKLVITNDVQLNDTDRTETAGTCKYVTIMYPVIVASVNNQLASESIGNLSSINTDDNYTPSTNSITDFAHCKSEKPYGK